MIVNLPTSDDFYTSGKSHLNFSWDIVISLCLELHDSKFWDVEVGEVSNPFWMAATQNLSTALAIAQQGLEFILKAKISQTSPFLLIANSPREYPKLNSAGVINFQQFRTIDSQDLIKVYNTFSLSPISKKFQSKFEEMRAKRNLIMHTVDKTIQLVATDIITDILFAHNYFFPNENYLDVRRSFLNTSPLSELHSTDYVELQVIRECEVLLDILKPAQIKNYFDFDTKQRRYICPVCYLEVKSFASDIVPETAILKPNHSTSTTVHCFVCDKETLVKRKKCSDKKCKGNVIEADGDCCLTCGN